MLTVHLEKRLKAISITSVRQDSEPRPAAPVPEAPQRMESVKELERQKQMYANVCLALENAAAKLGKLYDEIFAEHNDAIARLSIEIARKVLMHNISSGDYQIETIVTEALKSGPECSGVVVRLNPHDLADFKTLQNTGQINIEGIELAEDSGIGRAECIVESSKGIVKFLIDDHLEQITKALLKVG